MNQERIGKFIAKCRKEKGLTQATLAEKLGVTEKSVGNWENGRNMPDLSLFSPLCNILGISINDLMSGEMVDDKEYINTLEENIVNMVADINKKKIKRKKFFIVGFVALLLIMIMGRIIYINYDDSRIMNCNISDNKIIFTIKGQTMWNTYHTSKIVDNKMIYFFHSTIHLSNKEHSKWEKSETLLSLLEGEEIPYSYNEYIELKSDNVEVYYTDNSIKQIEKANDAELKKIINESNFMCSTNSLK